MISWNYAWCSVHCVNCVLPFFSRHSYKNNPTYFLCFACLRTQYHCISLLCMSQPRICLATRYFPPLIIVLPCFALASPVSACHCHCCFSCCLEYMPVNAQDSIVTFVSLFCSKTGREVIFLVVSWILWHQRCIHGSEFAFKETKLFLRHVQRSFLIRHCQDSQVSSRNATPVPFLLTESGFLIMLPIKQ
jgi:hypothetical protein